MARQASRLGRTAHLVRLARATADRRRYFRGFVPRVYLSRQALEPKSRCPALPPFRNSCAANHASKLWPFLFHLQVNSLASLSLATLRPAASGRDTLAEMYADPLANSSNVPGFAEWLGMEKTRREQAACAC